MTRAESFFHWPEDKMEFAVARAALDAFAGAPAEATAQAARETKSLISDSVEKVGGGSKRVAEGGQTTEEIVAQVKRVTDLIGEITSATLEQSAGISQVNTAVTQLDQVTQQNAALVEESAVAAESMKEQAQRLPEAVALLRLFEAGAQQAMAQAQSAALRGAANQSGELVAEFHRQINPRSVGV